MPGVVTYTDSNGPVGTVTPDPDLTSQGPGPAFPSGVEHLATATGNEQKVGQSLPSSVQPALARASVTGTEQQPPNEGKAVVLTVPGAPTIGVATGGATQASVTFTAPTSNGGAAITGYIATSTPGGVTKTGTSSPLVVTGLTNGTSYSFKVAATNSVGTGAQSAASNSVTPA